MSDVSDLRPRYRLVDPRMWDDDRFIDLSNDAKLLWVYLLTGPHVMSLPGLSVGGMGAIADGVRTPPETLSEGFRELSGKGMVEVDEKRRIIRIPNAPRYNPPANGNVIKGWFKVWLGLPESPLKYRHVLSLRASLPDIKGVPEAWNATFGTVPDTVPGTPTETVPGTPPRTVGGIRIRDQDQGTGAGTVPPTAGKVPPAAGLLVVQDVKSKSPRRTSSKASKNAPVEPLGEVGEVWRHYRDTISPRSQPTAERVRLIEEMLRVYIALDLKRSIDGYRKSPHHNGVNATGAKYLDLELMFRDAKHVEAGWNYLTAGPAKPPTGAPPADSRPQPPPFVPPPTRSPEELAESERARLAAVEALGPGWGKRPARAEHPEATPEEAAAELERRRLEHQAKARTLEPEKKS